MGKCQAFRLISLEVLPGSQCFVPIKFIMVTGKTQRLKNSFFFFNPSWNQLLYKSSISMISLYIWAKMGMIYMNISVYKRKKQIPHRRWITVCILFPCAINWRNFQFLFLFLNTDYLVEGTPCQLNSTSEYAESCLYIHHTQTDTSSLDNDDYVLEAMETQHSVYQKIRLGVNEIINSK